MEHQKNIICTLGPASRQKEVITAMADAGMSVVRINFSHGDYDQHRNMINTVREINDQYGYHIKILQDLEGYRIRIGQLKQPVKLEKNNVSSCLTPMINPVFPYRWTLISILTSSQKGCVCLSMME